ncbi:unnamed protein product [Kluyveromyces dobzhanskii CBS 2104]|uniref:WGS project CCBQ000000000 data, contig 00099 n=1 Tax=Kluyveromyces dobzhanskii CBS 2104 TaxID=1427455 RepID=A0A0A8L1L8_9SACH|nr:unnamed protein product [Kluyveromyces dobzhanskii CBS 2104]
MEGLEPSKGVSYDSMSFDINLVRDKDDGRGGCKKTTDPNGAKEPLLSFEPFRPTVIDLPKRTGWLKRTIKSAGSTLSKISSGSSRSNKSSAKKNVAETFPSQSEINGSNSSHSPITKAENNTENASDEVQILSYSSARSTVNNSSFRSSAELLISSVDQDTCDVSSQKEGTKLKLPNKTGLNSSSERIPPNNDIISDFHNSPSKINGTKIFREPELVRLSSVEELLQKDDNSKTYVEKCTKFAKMYTDSAKFRYDDLAKNCVFDPKSFNIDEPSPLQKLKDISYCKKGEIADPNPPRSPIETDLTTTRKSNEKTVEFIARDCNEVQLFDSNLPPCSTERNKSGNVSYSTKGILSNSQRVFKYTEGYDKIEDVSRLGPVPFPDLSLKERMIALLELVGAPEELKSCNDMRLSLTCLHPCLTKLLGFLWNNINTGLKENSHLRKMVKKLEDQTFIDATMHTSKQSEFSKLTSIHVERLNDLERTLHDVELQYSRQKAYNDECLTQVNTAMEAMTGVLSLFFSQEFYFEWQKDTKDRIDSLMVYLNDICNYFSTMRTDIILRLEQDYEMKELTEKSDFLTEHCSLLERENESLKAVASAYRQLQDIVTDKNILIHSLEAENQSLKNEVESKTKHLELTLKEHERKIAELNTLPTAERGRVLESWERSDYEKALTSKEEEILNLKHQISLFDLIINNNEAEMKNNESRYKGLETKVAILSNENIVLKLKNDEALREKKDELSKTDAKFQERLLAMRREINEQKKMYDNELQRYKINYEKTLQSALKVTLKAESLLRDASTNPAYKIGFPNRTLKYFMKKKDMFQNIRDSVICSETNFEPKSAIVISSVSNATSSKKNKTKELTFVSQRKQEFNDTLHELKLANMNRSPTKPKHNAKQIIQKLREWKQNQDNAFGSSAYKEDSIFTANLEAHNSSSKTAQLSTANWTNALENNYHTKYMETILH